MKKLNITGNEDEITIQGIDDSGKFLRKLVLDREEFNKYSKNELQEAYEEYVYWKKEEQEQKAEAEEKAEEESTRENTKSVFTELKQTIAIIATWRAIVFLWLFMHEAGNNDARINIEEVHIHTENPQNLKLKQK